MNKTKVTSLFIHLLIVISLAFYVHMQTGLHLFYGWFIFANALLFISFGFDKKAAGKGWRRTPESTFLWMAFLGAFPALFAGRKVFRHKTMKKEFIWPMWALFVLQIGVVTAYLQGFLF